MVGRFFYQSGMSEGILRAVDARTPSNESEIESTSTTNKAFAALLNLRGSKPDRPAIEMLKGAGIETLILTNAAGSLKPEMRPGSIMLIADHINYSGMNPLIGQHGDENFVPMTDAYDPALRQRFLAAAKAEGIALHEGVYCWYSGPSFETPAEIRMFQIIGGTAVGMSTAPETILARRFGLKVAGLSVITNLAAGIEGASPSHEETKREGAKAAMNMKALVTRFLKDA